MNSRPIFGSLASCLIALNVFVLAVDREGLRQLENGAVRRNLSHNQLPHNPQDRLPKKYSIEQAHSDKAQLHTIAFNGLAFITGDFGASTFIPPGKVCDFFGFQYMLNIEAAQNGRNKAKGNNVRPDDSSGIPVYDLPTERLVST